MRKYIKNIKVGDKVKVFNLKTNKQEVSVVSQAFSATSNHYYLLNGKTKVTGEHPYFVEGGWKRVKDLKIGDKLLHKNGKKVKVKTLEKFDEPMTIYNIEVEGEHNYYADGLLVHNKFGSYHGKESRPKRAHKNINSAASNYNIDVLNAADEALGNQANSAEEFANTVGVLDQFAKSDTLSSVGINNATAESTGLMGTLFEQVSDSLKSKRDARLDVGAQSREAQKTISDTLEKTNLVTQETRMELDAERELEGQMQVVQQESEESILKAEQEFKKAKGEALNDLKVNMNQESTPLEDAVGASNTSLNERWRQIRAGVSNIHRNAKRAWMGQTDEHGNEVDYSSTSRATGNFMTNVVGDPGAVQPRSQPTYKEGSGAYVYNLPLGTSEEDFKSSIDTFTK